MKFGNRLDQLRNQAWRGNYIAFNLLKAKIKAIELAESLSEANLTDSVFFQELDRELHKVNVFYNNKEEKCAKRLKSLLEKLEKSPLSRKEDILAMIWAFKELAADIGELKQYVNVNVTGFRKILKKHDKRTRTNTKEAYMKKMSKMAFYYSKALNEYATTVERKIIELNHALERSSLFPVSNEGARNLAEEFLLALTNNDIESVKKLAEEYQQGTGSQQSDVLSSAASWSIHKATAEGKLKFVELLLDLGANPLALNEFDRTPIHIAAQNGHPECLSALLRPRQTGGPSTISVDSEDYTGQTPLHMAAANGHIRCIEILIQHGANVNASDRDSFSPLILAAKFGHNECVSLLLHNGATLDGRDSNGLTAVHHAVVSGFSDTVEVLIQKGAQVNVADATGQTPLHAAARHGRERCASLLLSQGASISAKDSEDCTCIHEAAQHGHAGVLDIIVASLQNNQNSNNNPHNNDGAKSKVLDAQDTEGRTALHRCCWENCMDCAKILLNAGADTALLDSNGWSAHVYCLFRGHLKLAALVKDAHIKVYGPDSIPIQPPGRRLSHDNGVERKAVISPSNSYTDLASVATNSLHVSSLLSPTREDITRLKTSGFPTADNICRIDFSIYADIKPGRQLHLLGNHKVIGAWDPALSYPLEQTDTVHPNKGRLFKASIQVPVNTVIEYKYIVKEGQRLEKWEALPGNRSLSTQGGLITVDDGMFGVDPHYYLNPDPDGAKQVWIEEGWLVNDAQLRIHLGGPNKKPVVVLYDKNEDVGRITVKTNVPLGQTHHVTFPQQDEDSVLIFQGVHLDSLMTVHFEVYPAAFHGLMLGRATVLPASLSALRGVVTCPIIGPGLTVIGEITFRYLVIKPFVHPRMTTSLGRSYSKQIKIIGHRGGGANVAAKTGQYHRSHIRENTILSFVTAASLGAEYIEFDVQLTRDRVPVIYHNWFVGETGIEVPVNRLTLRQFKKLQSETSAQACHNGSHSPQQPVARGLKKSRSQENLKLAAKEEAEWMAEDKQEAQPQQQQQEQLPPVQEAQSSKSVAALIQDSFATLEETFKKVPIECGFNIEVKYPDDGENERRQIFNLERNAFVDEILKLVFDHAGDRRIMFSSFDPDVCVMLSMKQPRYPVFFLTDAGSGGTSPDPRCNSLQAAIRFARSANLLGIVSNARPLVEEPILIETVKEVGLILCTYGKENNDVKNVELQNRLGVTVIADHVAHVAKHLRQISSS